MFLRHELGELRKGKMMEDMRIKLQRWALMAQVLIATHMNHAYRQQRVQLLRMLILEAVRPHGTGDIGSDPVWARMLLELLNATHFERHAGAFSYITHNDAKTALRMFVESCYHIIDMWDEVFWHTYHEPTDAITKPRSMFGSAVDVDDVPFPSADEASDAFDRFFNQDYEEDDDL
jgi:hypothetical protein